MRVAPLTMQNDRNKRERVRCWIFTLNNYTEDEVAQVRDIMKSTSLVRLGFFGYEEGGETQTPHLQGYIAFVKPTRFNKVRKLLVRARWMNALPKSEQANFNYCSKDSNPPFEMFGKRSQRGKRVDLMDIKEQIDSGVQVEKLWEESFSAMVRYRKAFREYADYTHSKRFKAPEVIILWGPTGTGKSHRAFGINPESVWVYPGQGWFDGYMGHKVAIFDEFDGSDVPFSLWKRLVDKYPMKVAIKGSYRNWAPDVIVFTSNFPIQDWWRDSQDSMPSGWQDQMNRRITENVHMMDKYLHPESEQEVLE